MDLFMDEKNIDWRDLDLFLAVARAGGLSQAARATGRSPATLGRRMLALERALGRELFVRHDRGYDLTDDARRLMEDLTQVETRIDALVTPATLAQNPLIKISAGTWTTLHLLDRIDAITGTPPDIQIRFIAAEKILNIPHREVVIGIRNSLPNDENLAVRKMSRVTFAPYATAGAPETWIKVLADTPSARWVNKMIGNAATYEVNAPRNSLDLALMGKGIVLLPTFVGDAQPTLRRVAPPIDELAHDQWIVTHQDDRNLPEVRRTLNRMYLALGRM